MGMITQTGTLKTHILPIIKMWGASDLSLLDLNMDYTDKPLDDIVPICDG